MDRAGGEHRLRGVRPTPPLGGLHRRPCQHFANRLWVADPRNSRGQSCSHRESPAQRLVAVSLSPCQGEGRGFESRRPLGKVLVTGLSKVGNQVSLLRLANIVAGERASTEGINTTSRGRGGCLSLPGKHPVAGQRWTIHATVYAQNIRAGARAADARLAELIAAVESGRQPEPATGRAGPTVAELAALGRRPSSPAATETVTRPAGRRRPPRPSRTTSGRTCSPNSAGPPDPGVRERGPGRW